MSENKSYRDPKRKVGSQSEVPMLIYTDDKIIVKGYQEFTIDKKNKLIQFNKKKQKFTYINQIMHKLNNEYNCKSLVDIGCSAGLSSFIAYNNNFINILSLDHDSEYIQILNTIKDDCKINNIKGHVFSFGEDIKEKFDVVFCGALIHWIFSLTANFRNFDSIISYLQSFTNNYLLIEWVAPNDGAIRILNHIKRNEKTDDEAYTTENFENAINKAFRIVSKSAVDCSTRILYCCKKI
tara:strand:+ start:1553 stop:2266 length:714 start_codon:yes stop_codon:yes gene_type:complete